jgi:S-(hydroxymethyl)mycothiol dehydrogenase
VDRGVVLRAAGAPPEVAEIEVGEPGPRDVVVRIEATGVCHSDLHVLEHDGWGHRFPILLGHEGAGVVERVGAEVTAVEPGQRVVLSWKAPCGACEACLRGAPGRCRRLAAPERKPTLGGDELAGVLRLGTFATRTIVDERQAVPVPAELPAEQACLLGCAVATGIGSVEHVARVRAGATVCVIGCGGVGLSVIQGARLAGAAEILAVDLDERKREQALRFGATAAAAAPAGRHEVVFDVVARPETLQAAVAATATGGTTVLVGLPAGGELTLGLEELFSRRRTLTVSHGGDHVPADDYPRWADDALAGRLDLAGMVTRTIGLEDVPAAFEDMRRGDVIRSVIVL